MGLGHVQTGEEGVEGCDGEGTRRMGLRMSQALPPAQSPPGLLRPGLWGPPVEGRRGLYWAWSPGSWVGPGEEWGGDKSRRGD